MVSVRISFERWCGKCAKITQLYWGDSNKKDFIKTNFTYHWHVNVSLSNSKRPTGGTATGLGALEIRRHTSSQTKSVVI